MAFGMVVEHARERVGECGRAGRGVDAGTRGRSRAKEGTAIRRVSDSARVEDNACFKAMRSGSISPIWSSSSSEVLS